jgi:hypothetical protein
MSETPRQLGISFLPLDGGLNIEFELRSDRPERPASLLPDASDGKSPQRLRPSGATW